MNSSKGDYTSRSPSYSGNRRNRVPDEMMKMDLKREDRDLEPRRMEPRREEIREPPPMPYHREEIPVRKVEDRRPDYREHRAEPDLPPLPRTSLPLPRVSPVESMDTPSPYR